jgi:alpha-aminoadipate/glutamate carrier protein LysW
MYNASKNVETAESGSKDVQNSQLGLEKSPEPLHQILRSNESTETKVCKPETAFQEKATVQKKEVASAICPDCDAKLEVPADTEKGEILSCPGCGLELEVKKIMRDGKGKTCVDLQELTMEGEDWGE